MKEFDIELAKAGKPVCTRDGRKARILCFDRKGGEPIVALVNDNNYDTLYSYYIDGHYLESEIGNSCLDLFMDPERHEGWINIYPNQSARPAKYSADSVFETEDMAKHYAGDGCIATVKIEWEE